MEEIIAQGAEALLVRQNCQLIKRRIKKGYRHPLLDGKLRKTRTRKEAKLFEKASGLINVPAVSSVDEKNMEIKMDFINGRKMSDVLDSFSMKKSSAICENIGKSIAKIHDAGIIHGDLTTSNMILNEDRIFFVDFGLGFESQKVEDKAVDLHLLKQAFESRHFERGKEYFDSAIGGYKISKNANAVLKQLEKVEARGRYKGKH
ncbi:MAG: KEOPS complex kinase/ATPase Bud32 [archaeon]